MKVVEYIKNRSKLWVGISMVLALSISILSPAPTSYATLAGFNPGNIMDDIVMSKKNTMTTQQIQQFLKSKNHCNDRNLSRLTGYNSTRGWLKVGSKTYYYNLKNGHFVCMADQSFNGESAAYIIWKAAQDYNVNPQVLIVLLEKEQGLVSDTWPNTNYQYAAATGYDCPDTGSGCNNKNAGFKTQVRKAAALFNEVLSGGWTNYPVGKNYIQYHPNAKCGGSYVTIQNRATSSLYRYTPYQPNSAALAAGWGSAGSCGAYGNRNFYNFFTSWFGPTRAAFSNLKIPRWMQTETTTYKRSLITGKVVDGALPAKTQIYFPKKITVNGVTYLQTQHDANARISKGIRYSDLEEIPMKYSPLLKPRWMETTRNIYKVNPRTNQKVGAVIPAGTKIYFPTKITVGTTNYLRTRHDSDRSLHTGIPLNSLKDTTMEYTTLTQPRRLEATTNTSSVNLTTGQNTGSSIGKGKQIFFKYKMVINRETYVSESLPPSGTTIGVPLNTLKDITPIYSSLKYPRWFVTRSDAYKYNPITEQRSEIVIPKGTKIYFPSTFSVGGKTYLRTQHGTKYNLNEGVLMSDLQENYVEMLLPRKLTTKTTTYKRNPTTGKTVGVAIPYGTSFDFSSKATIDNVTYLRTQADSEANLDAVIPIEVLR